MFRQTKYSLYTLPLFNIILQLAESGDSVSRLSVVTVMERVVTKPNVDQHDVLINVNVDHWAHHYFRQLY